ncbi:sirohydrochlorin ferrochelatase [Pseudonocardia hierapolitana]|uniref:Sirohydrochlorin ferrochelatase n=1 Tax=Pseudonocardia hierapolitana TaxID=1128676 RepID=A0A561SN58_9PSEU|nr:CbiX/SirB N-terminal domain-containing protein [Pseudonocardia hierapolitana]TWF76288.1 sirohydrochlorin ferrochelatase [Pseudonocardia hierapolitana]
MNLLLIAHGTRDPAGAVVTDRVAERARLRLGVPVHACYADVRGPTPADVLAEVGGPAVAVPAFLAAGYHVRADVPEQLRATGRSDVVLADAFGPDPVLVAAAAERLTEAGARPDDVVVLAVAASSDPHAKADGARAARRLGRLLGRPVTLAPIVLGGGSAAQRRPGVADVVARLRSEGANRVAVASWLLAPGLFQRNLERCGADVVAAPLSDHEAVLDVLASRYRSAQRSLRLLA